MAGPLANRRRAQTLAGLALRANPPTSSKAALHKLEQEGWIAAEWKTSELGRRAKFYSLTRLGRGQLDHETAKWDRLSAAIAHVVKLNEV